MKQYNYKVEFGLHSKEKKFNCTDTKVNQN